MTDNAAAPPTAGQEAVAVASIRVLGTKISQLTPALVTAEIDRTIQSGERARVININVHGINLAHELRWLRDFYNAVEYVTCDSIGLKLAATALGLHLPARLTPPDWLPCVAELAVRRNFPLFFLGNRPGVAEQAARRLQAQFPGLPVAGTHHGYFDKSLSSAQNQALVDLLNRQRPKILYVGFGMPMQERWIMENWNRLDVPVVITAGAMLDYIAGVTPRAPRWLTDGGLEWLTRLVTEPRRLWRRYLIGNPLFLYRVLRQRLGWPTFDD